MPSHENNGVWTHIDEYADYVPKHCAKCGGSFEGYLKASIKGNMHKVCAEGKAIDELSVMKIEIASIYEQLELIATTLEVQQKINRDDEERIKKLESLVSKVVVKLVEERNKK